METPTKEIVTPSGYKIVLKTDLRNRDVQEIMSSVTDPISIDDNGNPRTTFKGNIELQNAVVKACIVSIDGSADGVMDKVLDMYLKDSKVVNEECMGVFRVSQDDSGVSQEKKDIVK